MWTQIFTAVAQLFKALTVLFSAMEHSANAINHLAITGEETAAQFSDEARIQRQHKMNLLLKETGVKEPTKKVAAISAA